MIRYDKQLNAELRRTVANFNAKVRRLEKEERELIPSTTSISELKSSYTSRYELKRKLKELQRFSQKNAEDIVTNERGLSLTKWDIDNLKREIRRSKYVAGREAKRLEKGITPLTITRKSAYNTLSSRIKLISKPLSGISKSELSKIQTNVNRILDYDNKTEQFQSNFFQMLFSEAGYSNTPQYVITGLQENLSRLKPEELLKLTKESPEIQAILDYYPDKEGVISKARMSDILKSLYEKVPEIISDFQGV